MPKFLCKCGEVVRYSEIPNPIEFLFISDVDYDQFQGKIDAEELYKKMKSILQCKNCGRLWVYWNGFDKEPVSYAPEDQVALGGTVCSLTNRIFVEVLEFNHNRKPN